MSAHRPVVRVAEHPGTTAGTGEIRYVAIESLLGREPIRLDPTPLAPLIRGRRVLVTGAGGSIGSELCRQVAALSPERLVMLDRYENGLHGVAMGLGDCPFVKPVIGDITDAERIRVVFAAADPHLVLHAAAHKHLPLMEANPCEAVKNNVGGTRVVADAAGEVGCERFVLISTDKAVQPSSVMGATKRIAELTIREASNRYATDYVAVRFGNILGSNGSVLPRFLDQINAGGPLTVTHPDVQRYFMLVSEAVALVLHAAALGGHFGLYVLDLEVQMRIADLARRLADQAGFSTTEMPIEFIGLRPAEKLSEALVGDDESVEPTPIRGIVVVHERQSAARLSSSDAQELEALAVRGDEAAVVDKLRAIVPSFTPSQAALAG